MDQGVEILALMLKKNEGQSWSILGWPGNYRKLDSQGFESNWRENVGKLGELSFEMNKLGKGKLSFEHWS